MSDDSSALAEGDLAKIDLGCHIDGYVAQAAFSIIVGTGKVTGKKADALVCAWTAM